MFAVATPITPFLNTHYQKHYRVQLGNASTVLIAGHSRLTLLDGRLISLNVHVDASEIKRGKRSASRRHTRVASGHFTPSFWACAGVVGHERATDRCRGHVRGLHLLNSVRRQLKWVAP